MTASMTASMAMSGPRATGHLLGQWRRDGGYRQADLARELGVSVRSVQAMEHGSRMPSDAEILRLERLLRLNDEQRTLLWELTHRPPPTPTTCPSREEELLQDHMNCLPYPAILMDSCWDLQHANAAALRLWGWLRDPRHSNLLLRCLTVPEGRARLLDWENAYAAPLVEQLRLASARAPGNSRLAELREAVLDGGEPHAREVLRRHWERPAGRRLWLAPQVRVRVPAISDSPVLLQQQLLTPWHSDLRLWVMEPVLDQPAA